ncbi:TPA: autotransporter domain-containing protein [Pseudomonas aeruginosa]|nr:MULTISPECIES: autotransporter outer membrane beta-barrel domain-containing protein [Pseudomonas]MBI6601039.1 autotransporter outer membrane beta-barrel domain-containing protein [Pseudomonas sp. S4_EA_1b]MBI8852192.1 autotransporter outer membrane beta-barrel domain-containing protein [Pseudomonas aeruginosa]OBY56990.1 hypothetical protein A9513_015865 [Pseudomonas sp. AU12215]HDU2624977.1 autotransporter outer membrane beta-barrel domain-containing protein [Pseudomonas aeruginosa]HDU262582
MQKTVQKSLLALAISAAAISAQAADIDMTGQTQALEYGQEQVDGFTLTGTSTLDSDIAEFSGSEIWGDVVNAANLVSVSDYSTGFDLNSETVLFGNLTNLGTLDISGKRSIAYEIDGSTINGGLNNRGTINVSGAFDELDQKGPIGYLIDTSAVLGDVRNDGTIQVQGAEGRGINVDDSQLGGYVINSGTIAATGAGAMGIYVEESEVSSIVNHGTIQANGESSRGVRVTDSLINTLINSGTIQATGDASIAVDIDGRTQLTELQLPSQQNGVVNSGTIDGAKYGIKITDAQQASSLVINQNGGVIRGGEAAIKGSGENITLDWRGGDIDGDILDVGTVNVLGYAGFRGNSIRAVSATPSVGGTVNVGSQSYLAFDKEHVNIDGNIDVAAGGSLQFYITPTTNPDQGVLTVSKTARFGEGSNINLAARPIDFAPGAEGQRYVLVDAGSLEDEGVRVNSLSYLLEVKGFQQEGNQLVAVLGMLEQEQIEEIIEQSGADANSQASFLSLVSILSKMDVNDPVYQAFVYASPEERAALAKQLLPEINGGSTQAALSGQNVVASAIGNRTSSLRSGMSSGEAFAETGAWVQILNNNSDQNERGGVEGFDADTNGIAIGVDGKVNDATTVGLAYSYLTTNVKSDSGNKVDVDGNALTLYGSWEQGRFFVDGSLTYSINDNDSKRNIVGTTAKGSYDSDMLGVNLLAGYGIQVDRNLLVEPRVAARYSNISIDSYSEKGSSAALTIQDQRYEVAEVGAGFRIASDLQLGNGTLTPELKAMAYHDFAADRSQSTSAFVQGGLPFVVSGANPVRDSYELGLGADYKLGAVTVGASYERLTKSGFDSDTFIGKVRYDF